MKRNVTGRPDPPVGKTNHGAGGGNNRPGCHSRVRGHSHASGNPVYGKYDVVAYWIPSCEGMTRNRHSRGHAAFAPETQHRVTFRSGGSDRSVRSVRSVRSARSKEGGRDAFPRPGVISYAFGGFANAILHKCRNSFRVMVQPDFTLSRHLFCAQFLSLWNKQIYTECLPGNGEIPTREIYSGTHLACNPCETFFEVFGAPPYGGAVVPGSKLWCTMSDTRARECQI